MVRLKVRIHGEGEGIRSPGTELGAGEAIGVELPRDVGDRGETGLFNGVDRAVVADAVESVLEVDSGLERAWGWGGDRVGEEGVDWRGCAWRGCREGDWRG